ncbi:MAG: polysaccharide biosynthesis/export family protein, partial [Rubripirellula sp.]
MNSKLLRSTVLGCQAFVLGVLWLTAGVSAQQFHAPIVASHACPACNGATGASCRLCADRNGEGHCDEFGHQQGIFTGTKDEYQCWQSPYQSPFNNYGQGGYAGPARTQHLMEYRLRPGDVVRFTYLLSDRQTQSNYRLTVGDELLIESEADEALTRGTLEKGLEIQPDGTITLRYVGQVQAAGQTIESLRDQLNDKYTELELYDDPAIDVTPVVTGTSAKRVRDAISGTGGFTEQEVDRTVTPQGDIQLPRLGNIPAHGLTLQELKQEINLRYDAEVGGIEVEPSLQQQAPHFIYVLGEVATPGRFNIEQPTTVLGAVALAGGNIPGANLRQIVIFRRGQNWELMSTLLDLRGAILGRKALPRDEIWLQDGDVVILPSMPIRLF